MNIQICPKCGEVGAPGNVPCDGKKKESLPAPSDHCPSHRFVFAGCDMGNPITETTLMADLARCLVWMEHINVVAEREEHLGGWQCNHTQHMQEWDLQYQAIRKQIAEIQKGAA